MIQFPATVEILLCLGAGILVGLLVGWLTGSFLLGVVTCTGVLCWTLDCLFSYEIEDDGGWNEY